MAYIFEIGSYFDFIEIADPLVDEKFGLRVLKELKEHYGKICLVKGRILSSYPDSASIVLDSEYYCAVGEIDGVLQLGSGDYFGPPCPPLCDPKGELFFRDFMGFSVVMDFIGGLEKHDILSIHSLFSGVLDIKPKK